MRKLIVVLLMVVCCIVYGNLVYAGTDYSDEVNMSKIELKNGGKFIAINRDFTETVSVTMFIKGGIFRENLENNGIGNLFANVWVKSSDLLNTMEFYGGSIRASLSSDYLELVLSIPYEHFNKIIGKLDNFINKPVFDEKVFNVEKNIVLKAIESIKDNPNALAVKNFNKLSYGDFPYSMDTTGTINSVKNLTLNDIKMYYKKNIDGSNMVVSVAGKFTEEDKKNLIEIFSKLPEGKKVKIDCIGSELKQDKRLEDTDDKIQQAKLYLGFDAPSVHDSNYVSLKVLSEIMGGGMSSLFFEILRKDYGYAYAVGAFYPSKLCKSRWTGYIGLDYKNVESSINTMKSLIETAEERIDDVRIENVKNYMIGKLLNDYQTNSKIAWYASFYETMGLGHNFMEKYIDSIKKVDKEKVINAANLLKNSKSAIYILKPDGTQIKEQKNNED